MGAVDAAGALHACSLRATLLDSDGSVSAEANNSYVTNQLIQIQVNPVLLQGAEIDVPGACGCLLATWAENDLLKRFDTVIDRHALEPILEQMLLGGAVIDDAGDAVGWNAPEQLACGDQPQYAALEFWADRIVDDAPDPEYPYWHFVLPMGKFQLGPSTHGAGFAQRQIVGKGRRNPLWGGGPYGDGPPDDQDVTRFAYWATASAPPGTSTLAASVTPSS